MRKARDPVGLPSVAGLLALLTPANVAPSQIHPADLVAMAQRHRVTGELLTYARRAGEDELEAALAPEESVRRRTLLSNAMAVANVTSVLHEAGVPHVFLKGLGLATLTRPRAEDRSTSDVDVLVKPGDLNRAWSALVAAGAQPDPHYPPIDSSLPSLAFQMLRAELGLVYPGGGIDLHWHAGPDPAVYPPVADAIDRAIQVEAFGVRFRTLSPSDALWHGALHLRGDGFRQLRHVLDVALLSEGTNASDAPPVAHRTIAAVRALAAAPARMAWSRPPQGVASGEWCWLRQGLGGQAAHSGLKARVDSAVTQFARPTSIRFAVRTPARIAIGPIARAVTRV